MAYEIVRFPYDGTIDADGHVLEPGWLWEEYLEAALRPRALRIGVDEEGLEQLELDGRPSERTTKGVLGLLGAMGDPGAKRGPERRYMDHIPYGGGDAGERIELLDRENLDKAVLYPTLGLLWECEVEDPVLTLAYQRAYNRWIADFCRDSGGRLVPIAHLSLLDPEAAADELERAVRDGCRGAFVAPFTHTRKPHGHPDHDPLYARACALDVPIAVHPTYEPAWAIPARFRHMGREREYFYNVMGRQGAQQAFLSFFTMATLERFPSLRLGVLEVGCGWIGSFLDRMDAVAETISARGMALSLRPSEYFRRQCFISGDPDETAAPLVIDHVGPDCFLWATDYPHPDHPGTWAHSLERFVEPLSAETRAKVLGGNVRRIYGLD
ncbi:MAG: amidohydrolase family protein [Myxococcota bacterium]|nr:amidohydrolase family protein [Myxococcota bacterium]